MAFMGHDPSTIFGSILRPTWSQIFRALALKMAKIQRWKEKGVILIFFFENPGKAKKALVNLICFSISN